jgi:hypothetical protein
VKLTALADTPTAITDRVSSKNAATVHFSDKGVLASRTYAFSGSRFMRSIRFGAFMAALVLVSSASAATGPSETQGREYRVGTLKRLEELPASKFRNQLDRLPPTSRETALRWLRSFHFTDRDLPSMHADQAGGIYYVCKGTPTSASAALETPVASAAAVPVSPFPAQLVFHSKPGSPNVLYINFSGMTVTGTQWNSDLGRIEIPAVAFSTDTDLTTFSDAEQVAIKRIWQRMAEDYAPFNIDVTTEPPATYTTRTAVALITRNTDANGALNPADTAGGVAYVNAFGTSAYSKYRPAWIYQNNLANDESFIAEAASHEIGHNMGLSHDGRTDGQEYYGGHGSGDISWGPLMGTGYGRNVSQWSRGEYYLASNTQDDLATIAGKVSYRSDDNGNTTGTAANLGITGGTNVVSTTPENDPFNTNTLNKGILESASDVDVFSFVSGAGPMKLSVNPWIMPSGTRGGNVDLVAELYNDSGTLLLTNNPASQTIALIQTNLSQGRYHLFVRSTGAGTPLSSSPSGYSSYGSIGQYFISGYVPEAVNFTIPPVATLVADDSTQVGEGARQVNVTYSDNVGIDISTIGTNDIRVTGPNGYNQSASSVTIDLAGNGTPRTATYSFAPPSGSTWSPADNGTYTVQIGTNEVADTEGAWVTAGQLGSFRVAVPIVIYAANMDSDPGWTLESLWQYGPPAYTAGGPAAGFTGTRILGFNLSGNYLNNLVAKYATTPAIDCTGTTFLSLRFQRWLRTKQSDTAAIQVSTNGTTWVSVWSTSSAVSDTSWQQVEYALPAGCAGSSSVRLRWSMASNVSQNEIGWNIDDVELFGDAPDNTPPAASLTIADLTTGKSSGHTCSVAYTDSTAVRLASLDSTDLAVTGPNGYSNLVEFLAADLPSDGASITATYSIAGPGGTWDSADNGTYTLTLLKTAVQDVLNNSTPQTVLGTFSVSISSTTPGILEVTPAGEHSSSGTVGGPFNPTSFVYTLTNSGQSSLTWSVSQNQTWATLSATVGTLSPGGSTNVTLSLNSGANSLTSGSYADTLVFENTTSGTGTITRKANLQVAPLAVSISLAERGTDYFRIGFQGYPNREYTILVSSDLAAWDTAGTVTTGSDGKVIYDAPASSSTTNVFYRVKLAD